MSSLVHPVDIGIFAVFLAATLVVGLGYGWQVKTIRDYALGGKDFSTSTLVATIVATYSSGSGFFIELQNTYTSGLYYLLALLGLPLSLWLSGQLATRMGEFLNNVSVAEAMGDMYGKTVQIITAWSSIAAKVGYVAIQFKAISKMLEVLFNLDGGVTTYIAAGIVVSYSSLGGVKAVTFTDVLQFLTFGTVIPILALVVWNSVQDPSQVLVTLENNPMFDLKKVVGCNPQFMSTLGLLLYFAIPQIYVPSLFQRIAMAKDTRQARLSLVYAAGISLLIFLMVAWVGILLLTDKPGLAKDQVVPYMINHYTYVGLKGLLGVGVMALAMSTADSSLNASSVLFANDIVRPLARTTHSSVFTAKLFSVIMGVFALLLALYSKDLLRLLLMSGSLYMPIFAVPVLISVLGFRTSTRAVLISMAAGFMTVVVWSIVFTNSGSIIPGMAANLLALLGSHYLLGEPGGWQKVAPDSPLGLERAARRKAWKRRIKAIKTFKLYAYLQQNLPTQEYFYFLFGLYTIAATYTGFYTIGDSEVKAFQDIYEGIYHTVLFATTAFLTFPIWPPTVKSQRFITFFWPIGMAAILFFAGTLLVIMSHFHTLQVMILMVNILMAVLLLRWPLAVILAITGGVVAMAFFKQYTGAAVLPSDGLASLQLRIMYGALLFTSFLIALFKGKHTYRQLATRHDNLAVTHQEANQELLVAARESAHFVEAFQKAGVPQLTELTGLSRKVEEGIKGSNVPPSVVSDAHALKEQLSAMAVQLDRLDHKATGYLRLEIEPIALDDLLEAVDNKLQAKGMARNVTFHKATQQARVQCDVARIKTLLVKAVSFLRMTLGDEAQIVLHIEDTQLGYLLPSAKENYTKKIEALRLTLTTEPVLPKLQPCYPAQVSENPTAVPQTPQDLPLVTNQRIVSAHYGYAEVEQHTLLYVIPVDVKEVRPKDMDKPYMALGAVPVRANDHYKKDKIDAQAQEKEFLAAVQSRSKADIGLVQKALEVIKWYHGPKNRHSGEPFYLHPLTVAQIVLDYNTDEATILGALLHDTVEDTPMLLENVETLFNKEVAQLVDGVTHLASNKATFYKVQLSSQENIRQLLEVEDQRVLYVKLADRLHNMRTIGGHRQLAKRQSIAEETMLFFVPLASQLGLKEAAEELKERCFAVFNGKE